jgi:hypothetical protein
MFHGPYPNAIAGITAATVALRTKYRSSSAVRPESYWSVPITMSG